MNYTELTTNIQEVCATTFTAAQLAMFTQQAEQKIYATVELPALISEESAALVSGTSTVGMPTGFLYPYSFAVVNGDGEYVFLLNKDSNFIREAYPVPATGGLPQHYAVLNQTTLLLGPTPDAAYSYTLRYGAYPESIVTATDTWLGTEFDSALLNGALVEAIRFLKGEPDLVALYEKMYVQAIALLKNLGGGKLRQDMYRGGQVRSPVR